MFKTLKNINILGRNSSKHMIIKEYNQQVCRHDYPKRIFSAIQPTGDVHLGNYLGAIQRWVQLQNSKENVIWSIADMHSITLPHDPKELYNNVHKMAAILIACGINPERSILFQQSTVEMHTQLCWVLGCITTLARLGHLPQFKEKSQTLKNIPLGLYIYPILQAADILLYRATDIPIGQDQVQHIQLAQELAIKFNKTFGDTFPVPHSIINDNTSKRIKALRNPSKKMSKSTTDAKDKINILDEPDILREKIKKAVTDCTSQVTFDPDNRPGVSNLVTIHSMLTEKSTSQICLEAADLDTGKYKLLVADVVIEKLTPIRTEYSRLITETAYLEEVLKNGTEKATDIASDCWYQVANKVGFQKNTPRLNEMHLRNIIHKV